MNKLLRKREESDITTPDISPIETIVMNNNESTTPVYVDEEGLPNRLNNIKNVSHIWEDHYGQYLLKDALRSNKSDEELSKLCSAYSNKMSDDSEKINKMFTSLFKGQTQLTYKERQKNYIHLAVTPPENFSPTPRFGIGGLNRKDLAAWFPRTEFSGIDSPKSPKIENFLAQCSRAQDMFNLSTYEFLYQMESCMTGECAENIASWINHGYTVSEIYEKLLSLYGTHMRPDEALTRLLEFKIPKNCRGLTQLIREIERLAGHASNTTSSLKIKAKNRNAFSIQALQRCLPPHSRVLMQDKLATLRGELEVIRRAKLADGEALTIDEEDITPNFTDVCRALNQLQPVIDDELRSEVSRQAREDRFRTRKVEVIKKPSPPSKKYNLRSNKKNNNTSSEAPPLTNSHFHPRKNNIYEIKAHSNNHSNKFHNKSPATKSNAQPIAKGKMKCSLCGGSNHIASQVCRAIRDDNGKVLQPAYCFGYCEYCKSKFNENLNHVPNHCPARDSMLKLYENGTVRPQGIYYNLFKHLIPGHKKSSHHHKDPHKPYRANVYIASHVQHERRD